MKLSDNSCYSVPLTFTLYENIASVFFNKEFINSQCYVPVWKKHHRCKATTSLQRSRAGFDDENKRIAQLQSTGTPCTWERKNCSRTLQLMV